MSQHKLSPVASHDKLRVSAHIMRALAHPLRLQMLGIMDSNHSASVNQIYSALDIEQSLASQHLRILRQSGLVSTHRKGKFIYYAVNYDKMKQSVAASDILAGMVTG